jgi:hypothetical protein
MTKSFIRTTLLASAIYSAAAAAEWHAGGGIEYYNWRERATVNGVTKKPHEYGLRNVLYLSWERDIPQRLALGYHGKAYLGRVNYDTYIQMNNHPNDGDPISTTTQYLGMTHEGQLAYRSSFGSYHLDYVGGLGWDLWKRTIGYSQVEDYSILFLRGGITLDQPARGPGVHGAGGIKFPFWTRENSHLDRHGYNSNPILTPGKAVSLYAEISYRVSRQLDVTGYYDSWRFKQSNIVTSSDSTGTYLIWQPESSMDVIGVKAVISF